MAPIQYEFLQTKHLNNAIDCLAKRFVEAEPMLRALGFSASEFKPFVEWVGHKAVVEGLSIVAIDRATHQLVGCLIAEDFVSGSEEPEELLSACPRMAPVLALLSELEENTISNIIRFREESVSILLWAR